MVYNEIDEYAADWLSNLITAGQLPPGKVDRRSIKELEGHDCGETTHLFAGIGGWPFALRLAGWPDDQPVWTGSCPCQPFSQSGKRAGRNDERHLWPHMFRLIRECCPATILGEQVSSDAGLEWVDGVFADLEKEGYACGACDLGAASFGAPHIRQRIFWCAVSESPTRQPHRRAISQGERQDRQKGDHRLTSLDANRLPWEAYEVVACSDGKRRTGPGIFPLAFGIPEGMGRGVPELAGVVRRARSNRVRRIKGYGNAIVPHVAAEFVKIVMEWLDATAAA